MTKAERFNREVGETIRRIYHLALFDDDLRRWIFPGLPGNCDSNPEVEKKAKEFIETGLSPKCAAGLICNQYR